MDICLVCGVGCLLAPLDKRLARGNHLPVLDQQLVVLNVSGNENLIYNNITLSGEDAVAVLKLYCVAVNLLDEYRIFALDLFCLAGLVCCTTSMESSHGKLSTRLSD